MALDDLIQVADNEELKQFSDLFEQIMSIPDETLTTQAIDMFSGMIAGAFTPTIQEDSVQKILANFRDSGATKMQVENGTHDLITELNNVIDDLKPSEPKRQLLTTVVNSIANILNTAVERYLEYDIYLPMTLEEGAVAPTYAHATDAAADLCANEDVVLPPHSRGTKISTGVRIGLPDGWAAYVVPRSSTGMKTPLRQSNCFGVIDSHYRGPICLLFDNISDDSYVIHKGDRLAQMFIAPVYHFKPEIVELLDETDRNEGGFGSTGN